MNNSMNESGFVDPGKLVYSFGLREGMKVADFGSGAGHFAIAIAQIIGETGVLVAVDVLQSALESLLGHAKAQGLKNIITHRGNLEIIGGSGLADASQDAVLMANILFQTNKKQEIIAEGARVLKSGGSLIVINWQRGAGGLGPPDEMRSSVEDMKALAANLGLAEPQSFDAGKYHFGLIFRKP